MIVFARIFSCHLCRAVEGTIPQKFPFGPGPVTGFLLYRFFCSSRQRTHPCLKFPLLFIKIFPRKSLFPFGFLFLFLFHLTAGPSLAHEELGKRVFLLPMTVGNAGVESEFAEVVPSFIRGDSGDRLAFDNSFSLQLTRKLGVEFEGAFIWLYPDQDSTTFGMGNTKVLFKYAALRNDPHEWIGTGVLGVDGPLGSERIGEKDDWSLDAGVFYGKGMGDLSDGLSLLRPMMIMGDLMIHHPFAENRSSAPDRVSYNLGVYYSIPYLLENELKKPPPGFFGKFFPMVEWNVVRETNGPRSGWMEVFMIPGIQWMGDMMQFGAGVVLPVNSTARDRVDYGIIGMIGFFDDFYPELFRGPVF